MKRIAVGITDAAGVIYGIRLSEVLRDEGIETHLIVTGQAKKNILTEARYTVECIPALADVRHDEKNLALNVARGPIKARRTVIMPRQDHSKGTRSPPTGVNKFLSIGHKVPCGPQEH